MTDEEYKEFFKVISIGLWRTDIETGKFLSANDATANILGYENVNDLMQNHVGNTHDREIFVEELQKLGEINDFEIPMRKKDKSIVWISVSAKIFPEKGYIEGSTRDITNEKNEKDAFLRQQENIFPHLQKISSLKQTIMNRLQEDYQTSSKNF